MGRPTVKYGVALGVLVVLWTLLMGVTGWYKDPTLMRLFWVVVLIEIGVLVVALRRTAPDSTYLGQVGNGTTVAAIAAVLIFCGSLFFTAVLFPNYFEEMRTLQAQLMRADGRTDAEIQAALEMGRLFQTPVVNALMGVFGTVITGLVASLALAAIWRRK